jgi:protein-S-isoprenylcysteine O-methyltransferase Ste14
VTVTLEASPRQESRSARLGRALARRRAWIFAPLFLLACVLTATRPATLPRIASLAAALVVIASWLLRVWATGYRTWVHKSGAPRYLMSAGPYAYIRHPLYLANGLSGAAALVVLGQLELLAAYAVSYALVTAFIVLREEEALLARFGAEHEGYRESIPMFCPFPGRAVPSERRQGHFSWDPVRSSFEVWKLAGILVATTLFFVWR